MPFDFNTLDGTTWLCEPTALRVAIQRVAGHATCPTGRSVVEARRAGIDEAKLAAGRAVRAVKGKVGVIPIHGMIDQRMSPALMKAGGTSCEEISYAFDALLDDPSVEAIVLHVDSPGGYSYGLEELSDKIYEARSRKPIYAIADSVAASAAYWLATSASTMVVTPGGDVGGVGVYRVHVDASKKLEQDGLKVTLVHAGKHKVEGNEFEPLTDEARQHIKDRVERDYGRFVNALKRNRGVSADDVRKGFGHGRVVDAETALAAKMVDRVMTFEQLMAKLTGRQGSGGDGRRAAASPEVLRMRLQQAREK